jgi:PAS domain S-box-containing protein
MNVERLFPRFSIRAKLAIAFSLLAVLPAAGITTFGVRYWIRQTRDFAMTTLEHDVSTAADQTQRVLREVEGDVSYLADHVLGPLLGDRESDRWESAGQSVASLLRVRSALFQVKAIGSDGALWFLGDSSGGRRLTGGNVGEGVYYALRAESLAAGEHVILPVELRYDRDGSSDILPAVAIVAAVRDSAGELLGTIVGEARASALFSQLERASPNLAGVTGLVGPEGLILYHSERKADWSSLLASRSEIDLQQELSVEAAEAMLATADVGSIQVSDEDIISFAPLKLIRVGSRSLVVYRVVPLVALQTEVRSFVRLASLAGLAALAVVFTLAILASHQFTQPIYQLREGTRRLAGGELDATVQIRTRDELEDLAEDFSTMAGSLAMQRQELEDLVAERTHALREAHAELKGILQHSADAIVGLDSQRRVRVWNYGAKSLFGFSDAEATGRELDDLLLPPGEEWKVESEFIWRELARQGVISNYQTERRGKEGDQFPVSLTLTAITDEKDETLGYSLIARDITLQTRLEEQMRRSERLAALSVLAAGLAHELGNPLAVLETRIECMEQEIRERDEIGSLKTDLEVLSQHAGRLQGLIQDFLSFAREEESEKGPVMVNDVVTRVTGLLEGTYMTRGVELELTLEEGLPSIPGSEQAFETVCMNLLLNALDATLPEGRVTVRTKRTVDESVDLEVQDTGSGIPPALKHRVFEPFFTTKKAGKGTGLGLAVCASIVERHGGAIRVDSQLGHGARFTISFPMRRFETQWRELEYS